MVIHVQGLLKVKGKIANIIQAWRRSNPNYQKAKLNKLNIAKYVIL